MEMSKYSKKRILAFIILLFICYLYYTLSGRSWAWYLHSGKFPCKTPENEFKELVALVRDIHGVLKSLDLTSILVYGSLFGALRYKKPLPWDNDVDILLRQEELDLINHAKLLYGFKQKNIEINYRYYMGGYRVTRGKARGDLMVFRNFSGTMKRVGIESYLFTLNYRTHHSFPARLIEKPLLTSEFCGLNFSVPRNGIEIQRYHYPHDWWLEKKPTGC